MCALEPAGQAGTRRRHNSSSKLVSVALAAAALMTAASSPAAQLTWDAGDTSNGATTNAASGAWNTDTTTNINWNNGSGNVSWTQTSATAALNGATFAGTDAAAGTYQVALDGDTISLNKLIIAANGYQFSGSPMYEVAGTVLTVADGKSVTFNNNISGPNSSLPWLLGTGGDPSAMTVLGNVSGGQFSVGSTNGSTLWVGGNWTGGVMTFNANVIQTNGTVSQTGSSGTWQIGRPGSASTQPDAGKAAFPGIFTLDASSAILKFATKM